MKNIILIMALMVSSLGFSQIEYIDSNDYFITQPVYPATLNYVNLDLDQNGSIDSRTMHERQWFSNNGNAPTPALYFYALGSAPVTQFTGQKYLSKLRISDIENEALEDSDFLTSTEGYTLWHKEYFNYFDAGLGTFYAGFRVLSTDMTDFQTKWKYGYIHYSVILDGTLVLHGWYINHTYDEEIIVNNNYNDSIIASYSAVYGCTDLTSINYNPLANTDDGSCQYHVYGCTDPTSFNYNPLATTDDGSCIPYIYGCTDPTSFNYNPLANASDGSCVPFVLGCTDASSLNYDPSANTDDGSCVYCNTTYNVVAVTACESYTWIDGNTYTSSNSSASFTETTLEGCDSILLLSLTIMQYPVVDAGPDVSICEGEEFIFTPTNISGDAISLSYDSIVDYPSLGYTTYTATAAGYDYVCISTDEMVLELTDCTGILEMENVNTSGPYKVYDVNGKILDRNNLPFNQILIKRYDSGYTEKFYLN